ncbi:hypothetical protein HWV23_01915 [Natronomonas halophila]|uniref:hypothetical protein n=1 Tax=Natronomonas halophila TaxID=2747817 RepID=UPI0015B6427D|nr:hypothetical protein [Natronomonas halophila]QLD84514.1 hypothetical protein HWV23_01915 [Natronomonas halophila]
MQRRRLLAALGATSTAVLAGCLGSGDPGDGTETPTPEPCTVDRETPVDVENEEIDVRELPEKPDEWTESSVETYVREYEAAYRQHKLYSAEMTSYGHSESTENIRQTDRGWRVELRTNFYWNEDTDDGNVHADSPYYTVVYLVADDRLLRAASEQHDADPSLDDATTLECW